MRLIIVESPAKAGTISKFLGKDVKVIASMGHLRDMPKSKLGVNIDKNFEIEYINVRGKAPLINSLKKLAKEAKEVYLATDPDREGEAISYHLSILLSLDLKKNNRVTFNEITKEAVVESMKNPRIIDMNLVDAQQARRVIDRLVGYKLSPVLWKKIKSGLSAGRVQSVALRLIIDRENEIKNFVPEEFWDFSVIVIDKNTKDKFEITYFSRKDKKKKTEIHSKEELEKIKSELSTEYKVLNIKDGKRKQSPPPPFTTSTLQMAASNKLGFTIKKTMQIAQKLYEGIKIPEKGLTGLITYMRTDSTRISDIARNSAKSVIESKYGQNYFENRYYRVKKDSQDAHEAIRPSYPDIEPDTIKEYLTKDEYKLYNLIYTRFLASLFKDAEYMTRTADLINNEHIFKYNGSKLVFDGFKKIYNTEDEEEVVKKFPELNIESVAIYDKYIEKQRFSEPKSRYTEATLVKVLEENGIGRPSTYAPTISTIIERRYVEKEKKFLKPTNLGFSVDKLLREWFKRVIDIPFTANIEKELDTIAEGKKDYKELLQEFYKELLIDLEKTEEIEKIVVEDEVSSEICELCGKPMVYKEGRFGRFLACSGFPECKNTKSIQKIIKDKCPECGSDIEEKRSAKGYKYYICTNKENCKYISWTKPKSTKK